MSVFLSFRKGDTIYSARSIKIKSDIIKVLAELPNTMTFDVSDYLTLLKQHILIEEPKEYRRGIGQGQAKTADLKISQLFYGVSPYVTSISGATPDANSCVLLLGDGCTSVTLQGNSLLIFDGCTPCENCSTYWLTYKELQECLLYLAGLKDCILYTKQQAEANWDRMKQLWFGLTDTNNCPTLISALLLDREALYGSASRLLMQYKALVALWNYVCTLNRKKNTISSIDLDPAGFIIQIKRTFNSCLADTFESAKLTLKIKLYSGQKCQINDTEGNEQKLCVYLKFLDTLTYILKKGDNNKEKPSWLLNLTKPEISVELDSIEISYEDLVFTDEDSKCFTASCALKVIPVFSPCDGDSTEGVSLLRYAELRLYQMRKTVLQQQTRNIWSVLISWSDASLLDLTLYYKTSYVAAATGYNEDLCKQSDAEELTT